jgi:hypothetical protein
MVVKVLRIDNRNAMNCVSAMHFEYRLPIFTATAYCLPPLPLPSFVFRIPTLPGLSDAGRSFFLPLPTAAFPFRLPNPDSSRSFRRWKVFLFAAAYCRFPLSSSESRLFQVFQTLEGLSFCRRLLLLSPFVFL